MIRFSHYILPKVLCGLGRMTTLSEAIHTASDVEHAEDENGVNANALVDYIKQKDGPSPVEKVAHKPWYAFNAKPLKEEDLYDKDLDEKHSKLSNHYSGWTDSHKDIIRRYTMHPGDENQPATGKYKPESEYAFRYINHRIMNNIHHEQDAFKMSRMDHTLKTHKTPHDMVVWSGVNNEHAENILYSEKVHHPAYLSTSLSAGTAMSFSHPMRSSMKTENRHVLKIHVPHGHDGAYIENVTSTPGEHEFVLPRDTVLRIDHSQRQVHTKNYGWGDVDTYIHHAYPVQE